MKQLQGNSSASVSAPIERCFALLYAVETYPAWYPEVVRDAEVLERKEDGGPSKARAQLHVSAGPLVQDFKLLLAVTAEPLRAVTLTRIAHDASDSEEFEVSWRLEQAGQTRIQLDLHANLSVPRFLPLGGIGDSLARGFVEAAARALET
jgi:ribosome-associated toxin RatA of RatAB toxin-antitoxin module